MKIVLIYLDFSIPNWDLRQKKLVLSPSDTCCNSCLLHQESGHRRDWVDNCPLLDTRTTWSTGWSCSDWSRIRPAYQVTPGGSEKQCTSERKVNEPWVPASSGEDLC